MSLAIVASAMSARVPRARHPADRALARFAPEIRSAIAAVCARDPKIRDLARSFPALLHRIAARPDEAARQAERLVLAGAPLKAAAEAVGAPLWTRRLPPEAFGRVAPDLPGGQSFHRRILNVLPTQRRARRWLEEVAEAVRWGEEDFVVWVARESAAGRMGLRPGVLPLLALFAFYSRRPELAAGAFIARRWRPNLKAGPALARAEDWHEAIELSVTLDGVDIDPWLEPACVDGIDFVPLVTPDALVAEAEAMKNCLKSYGDAIRSDVERIWSLRRDGRRVASLCVHFGEAPYPRICDLKGPQNAAAPAEVWLATRRWLDGQTVEAKKPGDWRNVPIDRRVWAKLWKPYWLARGAIPAELPLAPSRDALQALYGGWRRVRPRRRRRA